MRNKILASSIHLCCFGFTCICPMSEIVHLYHTTIEANHAENNNPSTTYRLNALTVTEGTLRAYEFKRKFSKYQTKKENAKLNCLLFTQRKALFNPHRLKCTNYSFSIAFELRRAGCLRSFAISASRFFTICFIILVL